MKTGRRLARTLAFQTLFEMESRPDHDLDSVLAQRVDAMEEEIGEDIGPRQVEFARQLVAGALRERGQLDTLLARVAPAFPIDQMASTDRVVLEIATHDLLHARSAPVKVIINEAVQAAKTYGGENSGRFVNGVLGTIAEELGGRTDTPTALHGADTVPNTEHNTTRR